MRSKTRLGLGLGALAALLVGLFAATGQAQDSKDEKKGGSPKPAEITPAAKAVQNLQMAFRLAEYGRENKAPAALLAAARVIGTTPLGKVEGKLPDDLKAFDQEAEAEALIAEAEKLGGDAVKGLAEKTRKAVSERERGAKGGPRVYEGVLRPGTSRSYQIPFQTGRLATITVRNTTKADLDLYVMCNRTGWTTNDRRTDDDCYVSFNVGTASTKGFTVRVVNYSTGRTGRYVLFTN